VQQPYTHANVADVADSAPALGFGHAQEARFATSALEATQTGFAHHRFRPGIRQSFGHHHATAEEIYFVVSGSGRLKLDDDVIDLSEGDFVRVAPTVIRSFEAGDAGLEVIVFGPLRPDDVGQLVGGWWI
jgi:mannose-6-phosphate isomerase-like protein (cupin superfamily)